MTSVHGIRLSAEVAAALAAGRPVVGLESSVFAQGLPSPHNADALERMTAAVAAEGAVPAITAIVAGEPVVGLIADELTLLLGQGPFGKVSARDLPAVMARRGHGATTVAATLALCRPAGIRVVATGGIGGVHREPAFDESADLIELSRAGVVLVCAGAKSILNLPATLERLETLGVPVVGFRTDHFPGFFFESTGLAVAARVDTVEDIVAMVSAQRTLGRHESILIVQPPPADSALSRDEVEHAIDKGMSIARRQGVYGPATTPFLLEQVRRATMNRSLAVNVALLEQNARLAAAIARVMGATHPAA